MYWLLLKTDFTCVLEGRSLGKAVRKRDLAGPGPCKPLGGGVLLPSRGHRHSHSWPVAVSDANGTRVPAGLLVSPFLRPSPVPPKVELGCVRLRIVGRSSHITNHRTP